MRTLLILIAVIAVAYVWYAKRKAATRSGAMHTGAKHKKTTKTSTTNTPTNKSSTTKFTPARQYKCVVIKAGLIACKQAEAMRDQRMLRDEAPVLPLAGCHIGECECKFLRYDDRRNDERRNDLYVSRSIFGGELDKREKTERRQKT
jgi:hypothetical protein